MRSQEASIFVGLTSGVVALVAVAVILILHGVRVWMKRRRSR
jgi:hypothetical protein